jgi:dipeptidyl aminopeptidase/acylaminoacyl peptidase
MKSVFRRMAMWPPLLVLVAAPAATQAQAQVERRQVGTATLETVPPIPADVKASVQRFQNYRQAGFRDWMPDRSILITTRFGATNQLHRVAAPGAARTQLTFFEEPVADAWSIPGTDRFIVSRDTGGDEWFQIYAMGIAGEPAALTEPGTRNQQVVLSRDGRLMAWSRALKGSADYAILTADPADPKSRRVAFQGEGAIGPADVSSDNSRLLISKSLSNRETRLSLLDLRSGQARELAWTREPARYEKARFSADGASVIAITDHGSDVRRLVEIDIATGRRTPLSAPIAWDVEDFDISDDG